MVSLRSTNRLLYLPLAVFLRCLVFLDLERDVGYWYAALLSLQSCPGQTPINFGVNGVIKGI